MAESQPGRLEPRDFSARPPSVSDALIGRRYRLLERLGVGGMGEAHRAVDLLTGDVVALKIVRGALLGDRPGDESMSDHRLALVQEFRVMASLRHPNIVSVFDYGLDERIGPYLVMDLLDGARDLLEATQGLGLRAQLEHLVQALRALHYLHHRGVIHLDLKPGNVLVHQGKVRVLDFGLADVLVVGRASQRTLAGTVDYIAPELFDGAPASPASDLYAVGVMAYQMFTGRHPHEASSLMTFMMRVHADEPDVDDAQIDPRLRRLLARLLHRDPRARPASARAVILELGEALGERFVEETLETRESFLVSSALTGREAEVAHLDASLDRMMSRGAGNLCLVGGVSGVGKTRLLRELRTRALAKHAFVLSGQAVRDGASPYQLWHDVLRWMALVTNLDDAEAAALQPLIPDIAALRGRAVAAPELDESSAPTRAVLAVEALLRRQYRPVLLLLEDLQWAGSESLKLLARVARLAGTLPLQIVATFRDDERPDLPDQFADVDLISLRPLDPSDTRRLLESIFDANALSPEVVREFHKLTSGVPFVAVHAIRVLANDRGGLPQLAEAPPTGFASESSLTRLFIQRLCEVSPRYEPLLHLAAVIGRRIDLALLHHLDEGELLQAWLRDGVELGVIEANGAGWEFSHDRLREATLRDIEESSLRALHGRVAAAIAATYRGDNRYLGALAHHWGEAAEHARAAHFSEQAGIHSLEHGAYAEAVGYFSRALSFLAREGVPSRERLGDIEARLMSALYSLGDIEASISHGRRALSHYGERVPTSPAQYVWSALGQAAQHASRTLGLGRAEERSRRDSHARVANIYRQFIEMHTYSLDALPVVWCTLRTLNRSAPFGPSVELAQGYLGVSLLTSALPFGELSGRWMRDAEAIVRADGTADEVALFQTRFAVFDISCGRLDRADERVRAALAHSTLRGDVRLREECHSMRGMVAFYQGRYRDGLAAWQSAHDNATRSGNEQIRRWGLLGVGDHLLRLGRSAEALPRYAEALRSPDLRASEMVWGSGMHALALWREGRREEAIAASEGLMDRVAERFPFVYWAQHGLAAVIEVLLAAWQSSHGEARARLRRSALRACRAGALFGSICRLGAAAAWQAHGDLGMLLGHRNAARHAWRRAAEIARRVGMPYDEAVAQLRLGVHAQGAGRGRDHLSRAGEIFERLDARHELSLARRALDAHGSMT